MLFFGIVLAVLFGFLFLPVLVAGAGVILAIALVIGAFWLAIKLFASGLWWGIAGAVLLALFAFFLWPVLLFV